MHHADARRQGVEGRAEGRLLPVDEDVAAVAAGLPDDVHAEEDLHQRALARAVLSAQAQDLPRAQGEIDVGEHLVAKEVLLYILHLKQGGPIICHTSTLPIHTLVHIES